MSPATDSETDVTEGSTSAVVGAPGNLGGIRILGLAGEIEVLAPKAQDSEDGGLSLHRFRARSLWNYAGLERGIAKVLGTPAVAAGPLN